MPEVQIKATHFVKPAEKTWTGTMALTEIDMQLRYIFLPLLYLYQPNKDWAAAAMVETLKESLAKALVHFYPFAGRLRSTADGWVALECEAAAMWAVVVEAEETSGVALVDLAGVELPEVVTVDATAYQHLVPVVDLGKPLHELPLVAVQLTRLSCGGVCLGFRLSHAVADGRGMCHFLSEWSRFAHGEPLEMAPVHDRALLRARDPPMSILSPPQLSTTPEPTTDGPASFEEVSILNLALTKFQMDKLKIIAGEAMTGRPYSRFEVLVAHVRRCLSMAREHMYDKIEVLGFVVDIRQRTNPQLPKSYNGNAIIKTPAVARELMKCLGSKSLGYTCNIIRQAIVNTSTEYVWTYLDYLKSYEDPAVWQGTSLTLEGQLIGEDLSLTSWLALSFSKLDFGWGKETHFMIPTTPRRGAGGLVSGSEDGSAIAAIGLEVASADKFKKYFYQDIV